MHFASSVWKVYPKVANLRKHEQSDKYCKKQQAMCISMPISVEKKEKLSTQVKRTELELAVCVSCHGAIQTVHPLK